MSRDIAAERAEIDRAVDGATLCTALRDTAQAYPDLDALKWKDAGGAWQSLSWRHYRERVRNATLGLRALGFAPGEFGVLLARNRHEHVVADMAVVHAGGTPTTLYNTLAPDQIEYIVGHCEATVAFVEDPSFLEKLLKIRDQIPRVRKVVLFDGAADVAGEVSDDWIVSWDDLQASGAEEHGRDATAFEAMAAAVKPDSLLNLIYTSGTTGPPKAVMNLHRNVLWTIESFRRMAPVTTEGERIISYLPLAHAAERFASHWQGIARGFTTHFCPDITQLLLFLLEVRPTWFVGVPRVWEKLYAGINAALGAEQDDARREMIQGAIEAGRQIVAHEQKGAPLPEELAAERERIEAVGTAILGKVGLDQSKIAVTGAAPISTEVIEFFFALGLKISEVWGMSELTAPATWNGLDRIKIGSVGYTMPGVEARLAEDGELLIRGGNVMAGYYRAPEQTAETLDADGWLHTGDVATADADGYYTIVDRKKELIITAGGKNISPANLENLLKHHKLVGQAAVIGDRRPYCSALIVLDGEVAPVWAQAAGIEAGSIAGLAQHPEVREEIERHVATVNEQVSRVESIRRFEILPTEWTAESEELTPTLKLKRRVVNEKYADVIESMYAG